MKGGAELFVGQLINFFRCVEASQQSGSEGLGTKGCVVKGREVS